MFIRKDKISCETWNQFLLVQHPLALLAGPELLLCIVGQESLSALFSYNFFLNFKIHIKSNMRGEVGRKERGLWLQTPKS